MRENFRATFFGQIEVQENEMRAWRGVVGIGVEELCRHLPVVNEMQVGVDPGVLNRLPNNETV